MGCGIGCSVLGGPCQHLCTCTQAVSRGKFGRLRSGWDQVGVGSGCQAAVELTTYSTRWLAHTALYGTIVREAVVPVIFALHSVSFIVHTACTH